MTVNSLTDVQLEQLTEPYYRGWITHYWEELCMVAPSLTFAEKRVAFFYLLERLLWERKIKLGRIDDSSVDWDESPEAIIATLKDLWPSSAVTEDDEGLVIYFYRYIAAAWLGPDGQWYSS